MASIHIIAHVRPATLDQIANIKSINVIQIHVEMEEPVPIIAMIIHAIVHTASPAKIVPNIWIGVHRIHVKMALRVHNMKIPINAIV